MKTAPVPDYSIVTELPFESASRTQMSMLQTRYGWAAGQAVNKDVLEVACGAGLGLGWLARQARRVEAGDIQEESCRIAKQTCHGIPNLRIRRMSAQDLPFESESFDLVLLFEALYYLPDALRFFEEARRVLRPGGTLLLSMANCEGSAFHCSLFHTRYFAASELDAALSSAKFQARLFVGFPESGHPGSALVRAAKRAAVTLRLMPRTMRGKAALKRVFYGPLHRIPSRIEPGQFSCEPLQEAGLDSDLTPFRTLYAEARKT